MSGNNIKRIRKNHVAPLLSGQEDLELSGSVSKEAIDFLTQRIRRIESFIEAKVKLKQQFVYLNTICGIGKILSLTIMLETGSIDRFPTVGNYVSYCRKVPSTWTSNGKTKGKGNKKTATSIWRGRSLRLLSLLGVMTRMPEPITRGRQQEPTS
jgi:transposase